MCQSLDLLTITLRLCYFRTLWRHTDVVVITYKIWFLKSFPTTIGLRFDSDTQHIRFLLLREAISKCGLNLAIEDFLFQNKAKHLKFETTYLFTKIDSGHVSNSEN